MATKHGNAGGTDINVDLTMNTAIKTTRTVTLSANYTTLCPPGAPTRPCFTGAAPANLDFPKTILSGTVLTLLKGEADALVAAGKAS